MTDISRAKKLASELSDRVYVVHSIGTTPEGYTRFVAFLEASGEERIYINVSPTDTWEEK